MLTKVRIVEKGFDKFSGPIGEIEFKDGVSVDVITPTQVDRLSAAMRVETLDGVGIGVAARLAGMQTHGNAIPSPEPIVEEAPVDPETRYMRESLEKIADEKGIVGLREIAAKYNIRGRNIAQMIDAIIKAQH